MSVFDCNSEISKYHQEKVTLRGDDQKDMRGRRNNGRTRLANGLEANGHPAPALICSQGSYRMWTMVQDADCDYDIDDGVYFHPHHLTDADGNELTPREARQRVCDALTRDRRLENPAEVLDNCVRQNYQAGYHIDMPVYRIRVEGEGSDDEREVFELSSKDTWTPSDARAVTAWFESQVNELNGEKGEKGEKGRQMRRLVRMTKAFARSRKDWKDETTSGITITRLVVDEFRASAGRDDEALLNTWKAIEARLRRSTRVEHPINSTPLAEDGDQEVQFLQEKLTEALGTLEVLEKDDCTRNEARDAWDSVFNTTYISKLPDPNEPDAGKRAFFVATESKSDSRDDGNGRYGRGRTV